ncbi:MAG TPA: hypothetical protein VGK25_13010 [Ignavibacteria bacterium]
MFKSHLLEIIRRLSPKELKELGEYVRSEFFNKNQAVISLYDYVSTHYPNFKEKDFDTEIISNKLFPDSKFNRNYINTIIFKLEKLAEDYLGYINFKKAYDKEISIIEELFTRRNDELLKKRINDLEKKLSKVKYKDIYYFRTRYRIEYVKNSFQSYNWRLLNYKDVPNDAVLEKWKRLLDNFFMEVTEESRYLFNLKKLTRFDFTLDFIDEIINYLKVNDNHKKHGISHFFYELMLLKENDENYFYKLKELLANETDNLLWGEKYSTLSVLFNFANEIYYNGNDKYLDEMFEINNIIIAEKLYSKVEGKYFDPSKFENIVNVGFLTGNYEWTEKFASKYKNQLDPENRTALMNYFDAKLSFAKNEFEKSLEALSKIGPLKSVTFKTSVRNLYLMAYYELGWIEQAFDAYDSYRHFLANDKVLALNQKERCLNFVKLFNDLLKAETKKDLQLLAGLKIQLESNHNVVERKWLMAKIEELEKG